MLLCRFSHVEGCNQNSLCRIMQRSAICVPTWAICCRCKVKPFQVQGKWTVSYKKQDLFPFPVAWLSQDSWQDLRASPSSQSDCQSSIIFFLKINFRKEIGALTDSGSLSDSAASFTNLSTSSFPL
ncbi:hypothetical protein AVEN_49963-1 [Araneus ventricosus]|uniref:Uncharacterized protein n=1 Tax=Araneus ventricosus TaxID=182803 RepID=A0A4Y2EEU8_ARAVE|nr:hypothetical protein AVEN_49963-1 [Araneus ventricosus]